MTREEAKQVFLSRGYVEVEGGIIYDADKWRESCRVISEWLEQEPCEDAISRQAVLSYIYNDLGLGDEENGADIERQMELERSYKYVKSLPSVKPQEPTGHWIDIMVGDMPAQACDRCNTFYPLAYTGGGHKYCPNCGCRMVEPQESEG